MDYIKNNLWKKYGLSIAENIFITFNSKNDLKDAEKQHDMVVDYLENNPIKQKKYLEEHNYWDIVFLAEKEKIIKKVKQEILELSEKYNINNENWDELVDWLINKFDLEYYK